MEATSIIKYLVFILPVCYAATDKCSNKPVVDKLTKTVVFQALPEHDINTNLSLKYDAEGLQPLFNLAISFMNTVQPKNFGDVFKDADLQRLFGSDVKKLINDYELPILITIGVGVLFLLIVPLTGLFFCCCRCCGKCGGDMKQSEKKAEQHCKVAVMVFFLFLFTVLMLCGVLFMFVTNNRLNAAYNGIINTADEVMDEAVKMANIVKKDVNQLTTEQVSCITGLVRDNIKDEALKNSIGIPLRTNVEQNVSSILTRANDTSLKIDNIAITIDDLLAEKNNFITTAKQLETELGYVQGNLSELVKRCESNASLASFCSGLSNVQLNVSMDFNSVPDIDKYKSEIQKVKDLNLQTNIKKAKDTVNNIPNTVVLKSKSAIQGIKDLLDTTEGTIHNKGKNITEQLQENIDKARHEATTNPMYTDIKDFDKYERIRWKVYVGLSAVMAFIVFILFCGLSCGSCGYNKEYMPTERSNTANCGGNFLMAAVGLMFIFSFFLMIFCVAWFSVGIHLHVVCREMKNGDLIDNLIMKNIKGAQNISFKEILGNCRENKAFFRSSAYIQDTYNISKLLDMNLMSDVNKKISDDINFDLSSEKILTDDANDALTDLINSNITNIDFQSFFDILNKSFTLRNLTQIIANLSSTATIVEQINPTMAQEIRSVASALGIIQNTITGSMKQDIAGFRSTVEKLQREIANIKVDSKEILDQLKSSQSYIQNETPVFIKNQVEDFANEVVGYVDQGITHIINQVKDNLGKCKPVANLYDGLVNTFLCDNIVQNTNGFWLSLGWCLLFFIPSIILSVKLAKYFRKMEYSTGMDTIVVDHPPYNDKIPHQDMRPPPPYTSTQHSNPGYQHV